MVTARIVLSIYQNYLVPCACKMATALQKHDFFTQLPVSITVIVEKFFLRLIKYTMQAG
jgi:hypothetical protein